MRQRLTIRVKQGKGKDRYAILFRPVVELLPVLESYEQRSGFFPPGQERSLARGAGTSSARRSKEGLKSRGSIYSLRACFATLFLRRCGLALDSSF